MEKEIEIIQSLDCGDDIELKQALEHLIQAYKEQQAELVKKDKIINEMSKELYVEGYCKEINCKQCTAESFTDCIKQYFEKKVEGKQC